MKKKMKKILIIILIIASFLFLKCSYVKAASMSDIISAGNSFLDIGKSQEKDGTRVDDFVDSFMPIGQILVSIAVVVIMAVTVIMAIKWIIATPDKKAKLKQQTIGLVVSMIVIFGAVGIWKVVRDIMQKFEDNIANNVNETVLVAIDRENEK